MALDIEERRARIVTMLSDQVAHDVLSLDEYERALDSLNHVDNPVELARIEAILKEQMPELPPPEAPPPPPAHFSSGLTLLSNRVTAGSSLTQRQTFFTLMGNHTIRISKGDLRNQETYLDIISVMGNTNIIVDPGITVISEAFPILGNVTIESGVEQQRQTGHPTVIITGSAIMANITVRLYKPGFRDTVNAFIDTFRS
ncbi:hypothetical protein FACS1894172_06360 [Spirochaetia bacterium]|nr:hypothetical protein FACS1894172_06360 [Spirochaetia bacterium]